MDIENYITKEHPLYHKLLSEVTELKSLLEFDPTNSDKDPKSNFISRKLRQIAVKHKLYGVASYLDLTISDRDRRNRVAKHKKTSGCIIQNSIDEYNAVLSRTGKFYRMSDITDIVVNENKTIIKFNDGYIEIN